MLLAGGLVVVLALAAVAYFTVLRGSPRHQSAAGAHRARHAASAAASTPSPSPTPTITPAGAYGWITTRTTDPVPLSLGEVFPSRFSIPGASYAMTTSQARKACTPAVVGSKLRRAVRHGGCSQVLRASYLSTGTKLMGTIGVLNLQDYARAHAAGDVTGPSEFILQLDGHKGPTKHLTSGTGIEEAIAKGHYLILVWGEFTSGHAPRTKHQRAEVETFLLGMINKTANVALSNRLVGDGPKPSASPPSPASAASP